MDIFLHIIIRYPKGYFEQDLQFDFFNYAGIHRTVSIYTTSSAYIYDINTTTAQDTADPSTWYLRYQVTLGGFPSSSSVSVKLFDRSGQSVIASGSSLTGNLKVKDPQLWWPWSMNLTQNYSYMYILQVKQMLGQIEYLYCITVCAYMCIMYAYVYLLYTVCTVYNVNCICMYVCMYIIYYAYVPILYTVYTISTYIYYCNSINFCC